MYVFAFIACVFGVISNKAFDQCQRFSPVFLSNILQFQILCLNI